MLPEGIQPTSITIPAATARAATLQPGQVLHAVVQQAEGALFVRVGGTRVPLPTGAALEANQAVQIEVLEADGALQLRVLPQPGASGPAADSLQGLVSVVLEALGTLGNAELAAPLVPATLPQSAEAVRALLALFVTRGAIGDDLQQVAALVEQAVAANLLPQVDAGPFLALAASLVVTEAGGFQSKLQQLANRAGHAIEARIALVLASGNLDDLVDAVRADIRAQLARLRDHPGLRRFLRQAGQLRAFEDAVGRLLDRLVGGQLQNLRGLEQPYMFLELPCAPDAGIRHAQLHIFGEDHAKERQGGDAEAIVALDLSLTRLGDLWVTLRLCRGQCMCRFQAVEASAREALSDASDELVAALKRAGYPNARIKVTPWDGDRLRETASLTRRFSGIDVQA